MIGRILLLLFRVLEACGNSAFLTGSFSAIARWEKDDITKNQI